MIPDCATCAFAAVSRLSQVIEQATVAGALTIPVGVLTDALNGPPDDDRPETGIGNQYEIHDAQGSES